MQGDSCCLKAKIIRRNFRRWHSFGEGSESDKLIGDLRVVIDELRDALDQAEDNPEKFDPDAGVEEGVASHDAAAAKAKW